MKTTGLFLLLLILIYPHSFGQPVCQGNFAWATMTGAVGDDVTTGVVTDAAGNVYVTGDFNGSFELVRGDEATKIGSEGSYDIFIAKFNPEGTFQWVKSFGGDRRESSRSIALDGSGNIYLGGSFRSNTVSFATNVTLTLGPKTGDGEADLFVVKLNAEGTAVWARSASGLHNSAAYGVDVDQAGNVYLAGVMKTATAFSSTPPEPTVNAPHVGGQDIFLAKYTAAGSIRWVRTAGAMSEDEAYNLAVDRERGSAYLTGRFSSSQLCFGANCLTNSGNSDTFVAKYNTNGDNEWARGVSCPGADIGTGIALDGAGRCYVSGTFERSAVFADNLLLRSTGKQAGFVACYSAAGDAAWATKADGLEGASNVGASKIDVDATGTGYITGYFVGTMRFGNLPRIRASFDDMFVGKFDAQGNAVGISQSNGSADEGGTAVAMDGAGNCYITGNFSKREAVIGTTRETAVGYNDIFVARKGFTFLPLELEGDFYTVQSACATKFNADLTNASSFTILSYSWNFGDGATAAEPNPIHAYAASGSYTVTLTVAYAYPGCSNSLSFTRQKTITFDSGTDLLKDTTIVVNTEQLDEVINSSAVAFSDAWPLAHPTEEIYSKNSYANASTGVWRAEANYAYDVLRSAPGQGSSSDQIRTATDGTYSLDQFNWEYGDLNAVPHWRKVNTITQYSPYSFELENRDILDQYSAALYDYNGQFPSATGVNMRQREMAFTGFEYLDGNSSGNWRLTNEAVPGYTNFTVRAGRNNYVIVEAPLTEFDNVTEVDVQGKSRWLRKRFVLRGNKILCKRAFAQNPAWTVIYFEQNITNLPWAGVLTRRNTPQPVTQANLNGEMAHSGKQSLKVAATPLTLKQELLQLEPGKAYVVSAWASINDPNLPTLAGQQVGIDIIFRDKQGNPVQLSPCLPSGHIIEGWQQVTGTFVCPIGETKLEITFKPRGQSAAWYDDLRLHLAKGNMETYVYDVNTYRLQATLDENNFASFYYYDQEGQLYLTKKETAEGIQTISETVTHTLVPKP